MAKSRGRAQYDRAGYYAGGGTPEPLGSIQPKKLNPVPKLVTWDNLDATRERLEEMGRYYVRLTTVGRPADVKAFNMSRKYPISGMTLAEAIALCHYMVGWNRGMVAALEERLAGTPRPVRML